MTIPLRNALHTAVGPAPLGAPPSVLSALRKQSGGAYEHMFPIQRKACTPLFAIQIMFEATQRCDDITCQPIQAP